MGARRYRVGELIEHQLHGGGVGDRQDQRDARRAPGNAPNRCTDSWRRSRRPRGRTPLVNQRRQTRLVGRPASSRDQISSGTCGRSCPWPATSAGKVFFERRLGLAIGCGVDRTGLLPRQAEAVQHLQHPVLALVLQPGFLC